MEGSVYLTVEECRSLYTALKAVEDHWGVKLAVTYSWEHDNTGNRELRLSVGPYEEAHVKELNGFEGLNFGVYDTRSVPLEIQAIAAVMAFLDAMDEHMRK